MAILDLKLFTPSGQLFSTQASQVTLQTSTGLITILPDHEDLIAKIMPGELIVTSNAKNSHFALGEGVVKVENNQIDILADLAVEDKDIDEKLVEEARKRAEERLTETLSDEEYATTLATLEKSLAQLKVKRRHRALS